MHRRVIKWQCETTEATFLGEILPTGAILPNPRQRLRRRQSPLNAARPTPIQKRAIVLAFNGTEWLARSKEHCCYIFVNVFTRTSGGPALLALTSTDRKCRLGEGNNAS